jgi:hypothetical protein
MRFIYSAIWLCFAACLGAAPATTTVVPFEYSEGFLWVQVQTPQSVRPLNFLFDTGAEISVINAATAATLGLTGGRTIQVQGVHETTTGLWPVKLQATAANVDLPAKYLSLDLSQLAHSCTRPLDGLLGADFVEGKVVEIDFQSHLIRFQNSVSPAKTDINLPLRFSSHCFCVPVRVNNHPKQWVRLDTGCATALQWVTSDKGLCLGSPKPAIGLTGLSIPQTQTTVSLGGKRFDQISTGLHRQAIFAGEAGLLGNGLLSRFKTVTIDTKSSRIILSPM